MLNEGSTYYELSHSYINSLPPSTLCHAFSEENPILQIGDIGILYTRDCVIRLDKSIFQFKGNLVNPRVLDPSLFNYLTDLNVQKGVISDRFNNESDQSVFVFFFYQGNDSDLAKVSTAALRSGSSRQYAGLYESGMRVYITENTYIRLMTSTGFSIARMYNNF